ncbi:MAG: hypothetical protein JNJ42_12705 [Burkholderiaceae bacterium]|nr:hypothetical protein [Burkholderiaceae bacterium]
MATENVDTVIVDPPPESDERSRASATVLPAREWYESPLLWAGVVVVVLLSIPMLLELSGGSRNKPTDAKANAPTDLLPLPPAPKPSVPAGPQPSIGGTAPGAPPRATPPSVVTPRPTDPDPRQIVIKCMEPGGRIVYTQTGACTGNMVPVPIDADKNVVDSPAPKRAASGPRAAASR